jgi:CopG family nickel-responsive transcriptional regulator
MPQVDRFSVSLDTELLAAFDRHICARGYQNRSEAIRDLIRDLLVQTRLQRGDEAVAAFLTLVRNDREGEAHKRLRAALAEHVDMVVGSFHMPVDHHRDYVALGLKGPAERVQTTANQLQAMRGVTHGHLAVVPVTD